jgi:hypothetical protein
METPQYNFPFHTCEIPHNDFLIAQPWSALVNFIGVIIIVGWMIHAYQKGCKTHILLLIGSLLMFEGVHTYSHIYHVDGKLQVTIIHLIAYLIILLYTYALVNRYGFPRKNIFLTCCFIFLAVFDVIWFIQGKPFLWYMSTLVGMFILLFRIFFCRFNLLQKRQSYAIMSCSFLIMLLFWNESYNCHKMLQWNPAIPYHALIEMMGTIIIMIVSWFFTTL